MVTKETLIQVIKAQKDNLLSKEKGLKREALAELPELTAYALIISGIRRCGKSTLLAQLMDERYPDAFYLNFEDTRLYDFNLKDFRKIDDIIRESESQVLLFDEIQIIPQWERYIRQKLDEQYKIIITGSNASLLSRELGTKLTGRHITKELFPFSYAEFNAFQQQKAGTKATEEYLVTGGFPEYVKQQEDEILNYVVEDILMRDIAVRYGLRDTKSLQRLTLNLLSNVGNLFTANRLKSIIGVGSTNTITEYLSHLENSYLLHFVPKFDFSHRKQLVNPRKVYAIDTGLVSVNSASFNDDNGHLLENLVFLHLRRKHKAIYYFSGKGECDFIIAEKGKVTLAVQVCYHLTPDNMDRELNGLKEALDFFHLKEGVLVSFSQKDSFDMEGRHLKVLPAHEFCGV